MADGLREEWIDGLRGIAACIVAIFHYTVRDLTVIYRSYWDSPVEENQHWIQIPPLRIFFAGPAMVRLFFVMSGYSLPLAIRSSTEDVRPDVTFYRRLTSGVFRRMFRLYIPLVCWATICHILFYLDLYSWNPIEESCPNAIPLSAPWAHVKCWMAYVADNFNCVDPKWNLGLNNTLWSIPLELRASFAVYLVLLGLAAVKPIVRLAVVLLLTLYHLWFGTFEMGGFMAGLFIAEIKRYQRLRYQAPLPLSDKLPEKTTPVPRLPHDSSNTILISTVGLLTGIGLMSLPFREIDDLQSLPPDYWFEKYIQPPRWDTPAKYGFSCYTIGAIFFFASLHGLPSLRRILSAKPLQVLGKWSFSIFLVHSMIFNTTKNALLFAWCWVLGGHNYYLILADGSMPHILLRAHILTAAVSGLLVLFVASRMTVVDQKARTWAFQIEKAFSAS